MMRVKRGRAVNEMPRRPLYSLTCNMRCFVATAEAGFGAALTNHTALYTPGHRSSPCRQDVVRYRGIEAACTCAVLSTCCAVLGHGESFFVRRSPLMHEDATAPRMRFGVVAVIHGPRRLQLHRRHTCSMACEDLERRCLVLDGRYQWVGVIGTR
jgi:hypothetical protein